MGRLTRLVASMGSTMLLVASTVGLAQQPLPERALTIYPPSGLPVIPVMEGWYDNEDGSVTLSFGYHNRNSEGVLMVPFGENNRIEPAEFDGAQPSYFDVGRHTGVFTITLPQNRRDQAPPAQITASVRITPFSVTTADTRLASDSMPRTAQTV